MITGRVKNNISIWVKRSVAARLVGLDRSYIDTWIHNGKKGIQPGIGYTIVEGKGEKPIILVNREEVLEVVEKNYQSPRLEKKQETENLISLSG